MSVTMQQQQFTVDDIYTYWDRAILNLVWILDDKKGDNSDRNKWAKDLAWYFVQFNQLVESDKSLHDFIEKLVPFLNAIESKRESDFDAMISEFGNIIDLIF